MLRKVYVYIGLLSFLSFTALGQETSSDTAIISNNDIPVITIDDNVLNQDDDVSTSSSQNASGMSFASDDPFLFTAGFTLGQYKFRSRGVNNMELQINGIQIQDLERGFASFGSLGGLNDVMRSRKTTYGLSPSEYAYGNTNGTNYIDASAASQRKGTNISFNQTNRSYRSRVMVTHNSGIDKKGWAYSLSASRRWANEGYVAGTFYDGYSLYGSVSKIVKSSQFNVTAFAAPTTRGQAIYAAIDEVYQLSNDNQYNGAWGYQNGVKRNSRVVNVFQPVLIANHTWKPSDRTRLNTAIGYEFGKYNNSSIDFYNAYNPDPSYYRNLPSYYLNPPDPQPAIANAIRSEILSNPNLLQLDWHGMYNANNSNVETIKNVNGIAGNDVTGKRSLYVLSNRVDDMKKYSFNTNIEHEVNEHIGLNGGIKFVAQQDRYYKQLIDLMGGDFFLNYNQFANQQNVPNPAFSQNDINNPNQLIKKDDVYGYDYKLNINKSDAWGQVAFDYDRVDFFFAANLGYTSFSREGFMKNGLFPDNSFGKSAAHDFITYKTKGGFALKINSRNHVYANVDYTTEAPAVINTYISVRTRDFTIKDPVVLKAKTMECGYVFKSDKVFVRATGYITDVTDAVVNMQFFNDDPSVVSFVNYILSDVSARSIGTEFSGSLKLDDIWSLTGLAALGQTFYTNRPSVNFYQDNQPDQTSVERKVYIKNYYLPVGPQSVYSFAINYRPRTFWFGKINFNYTDRNYVGINPDRRTQQATDLVSPDSDNWKKIVDQEKLPAAFTIDISGGKSFRLNKLYKKINYNKLLVLNAGVVNVLNNTDIKVVGYEQLRYDYNNRNPSKFPNKYDYAFGINYYATLSLRF
jgi:hypothetical protein